MIHSDIQPYPSAEQMYAALADAFCELVTRRADEQDCVRISLSGGSTPQRLYQMLAQRELPWSKLHWYWGDERNVPHSDADSNYRMVEEALLNAAPIPRGNIHPVPVEVDNPHQAAQRYEELLRKHFAPDSLPRWDLMLLGMGDDAHTASLFPETAALEESDRWFVANWVEKFNAFRYTLTAAAINSSQQRWFLISGSGKKQALTHVIAGPPDPKRYPSQLITPTRWFVTADAAP